MFGRMLQTTQFFKLRPHFRSLCTNNSTDVKPKKVLFEEDSIPDKIKVSKVMAMMGICSRREAEKLIKQKKVQVGNQIVPSVATRIFPYGVGLTVGTKEVRRNLFGLI